MATNIKLGLTNLVESATIKNGSGGGAPALDETSPYLMANVKTTDRYTVWQTGNPPGGSPVNLDIDLGSNKTVTAVALLGFRPTNFASVTSVKFYSQPSSAGYPPAGWTLQATINVSGIAADDQRDFGAVINSVSHRYWRVEFTHSATLWSVGKVWIGNPTDLGFIHSPGGLYVPFRNRLETPQPGGAVVLNNVGDLGADFTLPFETIPQATRDTLLLTKYQAGSFLLIDPDANFFEVRLNGGRVATARRFTTTFDANLELSRMP